MAETKQAFKGIRQVLRSTYTNATNKANYLWFVRETTGDTMGKIYLGTREYGSVDSTDWSGVTRSLAEFIANSGDVQNKTVKEYIDEKTSGGTKTVKATGTGDTYISVTATPTSSTSGDVTVNYNISATTALTNAITAATNALQAISGGTDGTYVTTTVGAKDANNKQTVAVALTYKDVSGATSNDNGVAQAYSAKQYADTKNVTITESTTSTTVAKEYFVKQGTTNIGTISIPKDMVVSSGSVVVNPAGQPAGTYIELVLNNGDKLYINVANLVDAYSGTSGVSVSGYNISLKLDSTKANGLVVDATSGLGLNVATSAQTGAMSSTDKAKLDKTKISGNTITIGNDSITPLTAITKADVEAVLTGTVTSHTHSLTALTDADDVKAIEALTGTTGLLKKTAANTWTLDTNSYITGITKSDVENVLTGNITSHTHDIYSLTSHTHAFADLTNTPTTVSGYGITDVYTKDEIDSNELVVSAALNDLDDRLEVIENDYINNATGAVSGTSSNYLAVNNTSSGRAKVITYGAKVVNVSSATSSNTGLADAYQTKQYVDSAISSGSYSGVTAGDGISATTVANHTQTVSVKKETATDTTVQNGHIAIDSNGSGELYGTMYIFGDDLETS